ncbi:MAG: flagellar biosynthesis repressor FlbT [Beijerinckiaceae bacterium]
MLVNLRAGEKIYLNGAVFTADRRVTLKILNDVTFLLASHVLQPEQATTPLKQLYFAVQSALMDPAGIEPISMLIKDMLDRTIRSFSNRDVIDGLREVDQLIQARKHFEALRTIRGLYPIEDAILGRAARPTEQAA